MIIDILQKELLTSSSTSNTQDDNLYTREGFVHPNPRRQKKKSHTGEKGKTLLSQQFQPFPVATNRYALLDNTQEATEMSRHLNKSSEVVSTRKLKKFLPKTMKKKQKIVIIGDSHARGYAAEISSVLGKDFEVTGTVIPGAGLENITNSANNERSTLGKSDTVIVIGGANDINKNETNTGLKHLRNFAENRRNTNIMVMTAPHRYVLHGSSCVNNEVAVFNRKLHKVVKTVENVKSIQAPLNRNDFTRLGMHLNASGKEKVAKLIGESIRKLTTKKEISPSF
jgi:hypothetical protein